MLSTRITQRRSLETRCEVGPRDRVKPPRPELCAPSLSPCFSRQERQPGRSTSSPSPLCPAPRPPKPQALAQQGGGLPAACTSSALRPQPQPAPHSALTWGATSAPAGSPEPSSPWLLQSALLFIAPPPPLLPFLLTSLKDRSFPPMSSSSAATSGFTALNRTSRLPDPERLPLELPFPSGPTLPPRRPPGPTGWPLQHFRFMCSSLMF